MNRIKHWLWNDHSILCFDNDISFIQMLVTINTPNVHAPFGFPLLHHLLIIQGYDHYILKDTGNLGMGFKRIWNRWSSKTAWLKWLVSIHNCLQSSPLFIIKTTGCELQ